MPTAILRRADGSVVCDVCTVADSPWSRLRGLLGRPGLRPGEGLLLRPAPSIHTFFMRFSIDAVFLDETLTVLSVKPGLRPWRTAGNRRARAVLELASGESGRRGLRPGDRLVLSAC